MSQLLTLYDTQVAQQIIQDDQVQRQLLTHFQRVQNQLMQQANGWFNWRQKPIQGIYLHGPVGRGKTYLMDLFFQTLNLRQKARFHFHHFMQQVDEQLRRIQGQKDPLRQIAAQVAKSTRVLCLDEFMVYDIADAMILAELLHSLLSKQVVIVATSNTAPDNLYWNGLQRARFLPAIELIKTHCQILPLLDQHDYRLGRSPSLQAYFYPLTDETEKALTTTFDGLAKKNIISAEEISIQHRLIPFVKRSDEMIWFEFNVICNLPRSQLDYLELAERFDTLFISNIPILGKDDISQVILFMHLIDVMYDKGAHVIMSANAPIDGLYPEGTMIKSFQRTISRLEEMQSTDYLKRHPRRALDHFG